MQPIVDQLTHLANEFDARVQATPADSWTNVSPCEGWTARDVVVHMSNNFNGIAGFEEKVGEHENIVEAWNAAKARLEERMTGDLTVAVPGPMGPMPLAQMLGRFVSMDTLVHTFDLARAVGGNEQLDEQAVAMAYSAIKPMGDMIRRPGVFGPATEAPEGCDLQTEFLCFLGRPA
jgi:uncharacterized protein (TIGR03086 family)